MKTEFEIMFLGVDLEELEKKLLSIHANKLGKREFFKRMIYAIPGVDFSTFVRVRDEGDTVTLTVKSVGEYHGSDQFAKELETVVGDFETTCQIVSKMGMEEVRYEENWRTKWILDDVEICIDERPGVSPYLEIEGPNEEAIIRVSLLLGYVYEDGVFGNLFQVAQKELGYTLKSFHNLSEITFENPLILQH